MSEEEFHTLAGLQAAVQYTEKGTPGVEKMDLLSHINSFYPPHMQQSKGSLKKISKLFKQRSVDNKQVQEEFWKQYNDALTKVKDPHQLKCRYLQMCWHKPYYGSMYFRGVVERSSLLPNNEQVLLAVNTDCIHLLSSSLPSVSPTAGGRVKGDNFVESNVGGCLGLWLVVGSLYVSYMVT